MLQRLYCLILVTLLVLLPSPATAQGTDWQERRTLLFSILYPREAEATANQYAQFVDAIYEETSAFWGHRPPPPVILRIYPTLDLYYEANPIAANLPGVVAHAHTGRREISIAIPQTVGQSEEEIQNNVRHELTHIIAADLSGGRLTTPWQEGIAQYIEHPTPQLDSKMELMRQLIAEDRLLTWSELNQPGATYADPRVGYPQSLTMVAFLIQRDGVDRFRTFVEAWQNSSGYRGALETVYGVSPDTLEQEWLAQLPQFVSDGYRNLGSATAANNSFDLSAAEQLIAQGDYAGVIRTVRPLLPAIQNSGDGQALQRAQSMLALAEIGEGAKKLATDARDALMRGDYEAAITASNTGREQFQSIGQTEQANLLDEYAALAERGTTAKQQLQEAGALLRRLRINEAHTMLGTAYTTFVELGDQPRAAQAQNALALIARGQQALAAACFVCALLLVALSSSRRVGERRTALPFT